jgi:peroxin-13
VPEPAAPSSTAGGPEGPPRPPGAWESVLRGLHGVMGVFGRITMLVDENTYAVNFFIQALLQLLDRSALVPPG